MHSDLAMFAGTLLAMALVAVWLGGQPSDAEFLRINHPLATSGRPPFRRRRGRGRFTRQQITAGLCLAGLFAVAVLLLISEI